MSSCGLLLPDRRVAQGAGRRGSQCPWGRELLAGFGPIFEFCGCVGAPTRRARTVLEFAAGVTLLACAASASQPPPSRRCGREDGCPGRPAGRVGWTRAHGLLRPCRPGGSVRHHSRSARRRMWSAGAAIGGRCRISGGFMRGRSFGAGAWFVFSFFLIIFVLLLFYFTAI